ncbi:MAG: hypothetical protein LBK44_07405 [Spirochaetales bacterium]|jgi:hypothetical protein|nr:hypothetical protein [Spirochaetales bacterium]
MQILRAFRYNPWRAQATGRLTAAQKCRKREGTAYVLKYPRGIFASSRLPAT